MNTKRSLSSYKVRDYTKNFKYFEEYKSKHRIHQLEALSLAQAETKGQVISPCGTGKTRIQISLHIEEMIRLNKEYDCGVFAIASHRLSLNLQLLDQLVDVAVNTGLPFDVVYIGSLRCDFNKYYTKYHHLGYKPSISRHLVSLNTEQISKFIAESKDLNKSVVVVSTYDSLPKLSGVDKINILTFDEAHNSTQNDFKENIIQIKPIIEKEYYFTATRKVVGLSGGMNDEPFYGKIISDTPPKLMLERGEIACPKLHLIDNKDDQISDPSNTNMLIKNTKEAFIKHKENVKASSASPDDVGAKLLIVCNSIEEMIRVYNSSEFVSFSIENNIKSFAISSDGSFSDRLKVSKDKFFSNLNSLSDCEDAIIFNVDMLTEGMDLPSITGVMPLRNLGLTKLIQLIGRALRLHKNDRVNLYSGSIMPGDYKKYVKPYGYLVVPKHLSSIDEYDKMIDTAKIFYSIYRTKAEELVIQEKFISHKPSTLNSVIPFNSKNVKDYVLDHTEINLVNEINLNNFKEEYSKASNKIKFFEDIFK